MPHLDASNFWVVNWYYLVAIVVSISALVFSIKNYRKRKYSNELYKGVWSKSISVSTQNHIPVNVVTNINTNENIKTLSALSTSTADDKAKNGIRILFIDDNHTDYKMVSILKKAGWTNTKAVKDILDLDNHNILEADIIFVDINGVGTTMFEDQGLGLASALKTKHPQKKVVIYSAETSGDRFHKALRQVDDCLAKNAEPYQFIDLVESLTKK